ncbi:MAG: energy transducer TonB [Desulfatirhabdiaceae bacterium]
MKRLWIAALLAVGFHAIVLKVDFIKPAFNRRAESLTKPVLITLASPPPVASPIEPVVRTDPPVFQNPDSPSQPKAVAHPKPQTKFKPEAKPSPTAHPLKKPVLEPMPKVAQEIIETIGNNSTPHDMPVDVSRITKAETQTDTSPATDAHDAHQPAPEPEIREAYPLYQSNPPPSYPQQARKRGFQGTVILKVLIGTDGNVSDIDIQETSGHSILDQAARETVGGWIFKPGYRGNEPVEMWIRVPIRFELK